MTLGRCFTLVAYQIRIEGVGSLCADRVGDKVFKPFTDTGLGAASFVGFLIGRDNTVSSTRRIGPQKRHSGFGTRVGDTKS